MQLANCIITVVKRNNHMQLQLFPQSHSPTMMSSHMHLLIIIYACVPIARLGQLVDCLSHLRELLKT